MKQTLLYLFLVVLTSLNLNIASGQNCAIDSSNIAPGIYPDTLSTGYVGQFYSEDINFVLPTDTMGYTFLNFHILSISLPVGLNWQCNNFANGCNYNPAINTYGCVNVYGTPLLPGQYPIDVTVIADLNIVSGYPVTFQSYIEILPNNNTTSNGGFNMNGAAGCAPITVNFTNNNPGLIKYAWNFGNGNTSSNENPAPQVYTNPGNYIVNYSAWNDTTTVHVYTLNSVTINTIQNVFSWGWPTELNPDPYFKIKENGVVIYQSTYVADTYPPLTWPVSIIMDPLKTYVMEVWDEDDYEIFYGGDDLIGSHTMNLNGCSGCAAGNDAIVSYSINHVVIPPTPFITSVDTVHVYGYPGIPNIVYDSLNHFLYTDSLQYALQWYFNGSPIQGANNDTFVVNLSGNYWLAAINLNGCPSFSDTLTAVYCGNTYSPIVIVNGSLLSTNDTLGNTYQWYFGGVAIPGATNSSFTAPTAGNYTLEITNSYGCKYTSAVATVTVGIDELVTASSFQMYPNPTQDNTLLSWPNHIQPTSIRICDLTGKLIEQFPAIGLSHNLSLRNYERGMYLILINGEGFSVCKRIIKQ